MANVAKSKRWCKVKSVAVGARRCAAYVSTLVSFQPLVTLISRLSIDPSIYVQYTSLSLCTVLARAQCLDGEPQVAANPNKKLNNIQQKQHQYEACVLQLHVIVNPPGVTWQDSKSALLK